MFHVFSKFNLICIQLAKIRLFFQTNKRNVIFSRRACFFIARDEVVQSVTPPYSKYRILLKIIRFEKHHKTSFNLALYRLFVIFMLSADIFLIFAR